MLERWSIACMYFMEWPNALVRAHDETSAPQRLYSLLKHCSLLLVCEPP